jgi:UDP-N-acetylmuramate--alanine ligase
MHVFFSGIGGAGLSGLALIAKQAGYEVSGSDMAVSSYTAHLRDHGVSNIQIGQSGQEIARVHSTQPIDWFVYSSALPSDNPELEFCRQNNIRTSKRDEFLNQIIQDKQLKLVAIAGTHGKSTVTAMAIWLFKQCGLPLSYLVGAKISFGEPALLDSQSQYFIYECDEYDRNFLNFYPETALISGIDYDHPDIYPTRENYYGAFNEFIGQSTKTVLWHDDAEKLALEAGNDLTVLDEKDPLVDERLKLPGRVNRLDAWLAAKGLQPIVNQPLDELIEKMNEFPGLSRRFEELAPNLYTDYAHTPPKIRGALQMAREVSDDNVVVVYEGLHNTRQHFIKDDLTNLFENVKKLYIVPNYLAREDKNLELLSPDKLLNLLSNSTKEHSEAAELNDELAEKIKTHTAQGDLVLCLSAGGAGSLDEWLRRNLSK